MMNYANDNYEFVENNGELEGFNINEAAALYKGAYYNDEYEALYNDGWVINETETEFEFASENGAYYMTFNKGRVMMLAS